ncbi:17126_t:CDS:2 [Funneliformis geosporum]|nr:17126_t:CDS:2 [Funneliformis geosporum]
MDSELMKWYVDYLKDVKDVDGSRALMLMIYDSFCEHLKKSVKQKFHDCGFDLVVILISMDGRW